MLFAALTPDRQAPWTVPRYFEIVCSPQKYQFEARTGLAMFSQCFGLVFVDAYEQVPKKFWFPLHDVRQMLFQAWSALSPSPKVIKAGPPAIAFKFKKYVQRPLSLALSLTTPVCSIGEDIEVKILNSLTSTVAELSHRYPYILCQDVQLQPTGVYQLNFNVYNSVAIQTSTIYLKIDGRSVFNYLTPTPSTFSTVSANFTANYATTQICFDSTFTVSPYTLTMAPCLDNITLMLLYVPSANISTSNLTNILNQTVSPSISTKKTSISQEFSLDENVIKLVSAAGLSIPAKLVISFRCAYLLLDDVWLYDYSQKNYTGKLEVIFKTIATIQLLKFQYLEKYIGFGGYRSKLGISDYRNYSYPRFVEVEDASSVFLDSNFSFFVYSLPQNILLCVALCIIFHLLWKYSISKFIRKFYFLKTVLAIALLQENLGYFVFVCLLNTNHSFSFVATDKAYFGLTMMLMFCLVVFTICFYPLLLKYLKKKAGHFADFTYREIAGFWYRSVHIVRNVLRAVVFCFFHRQFLNQMIALSVVEALMISVSISTESIKCIFKSRAMYSCHLIYYSLFIMLNCALYAEEQTAEESILIIIEQYEQTTLYCLIAVTILMMVFDVLSFNRVKIVTKQQFQRQLFTAAAKHKLKTKVQSRAKVVSIKKDPLQNQKHKIKKAKQNRMRKQLNNNYFGVENKASNINTNVKMASLEVKSFHKDNKIEHNSYLGKKRTKQ